jgi:hypothetical protein
MSAQKDHLMPRTPPESHGLQGLEGLALLLPEVTSYQSKIGIRPVCFDLFFKSSFPRDHCHVHLFFV